MPTDPPDFQWLQPRAFYTHVRELIRSGMAIESVLEKLTHDRIMIDRGFDEFRKAQMEMSQLAAEGEPDLELTHVCGNPPRKIVSYCGENWGYFKARASEDWPEID